VNFQLFGIFFAWNYFVHGLIGAASRIDS